MSQRLSRRDFASRPSDPDNWVKAADTWLVESETARFTARLTIDVTPDLRGRIKIAAFERGNTVAQMLRELLAHEFPSTEGDQP